jgi:hypothetical protein
MLDTPAKTFVYRGDCWIRFSRFKHERKNANAFIFLTQRFSFEIQAASDALRKIANENKKFAMHNQKQP